MTSNRPYLIRAVYEWIVDNGLTPHLLVLADNPNVVVPRRYVEDGKIVLNISPIAVRGLVIGNDEITFSGRFGGAPMNVVVPVSQATAIYARENGKGMVFAPEEGGGGPDKPTGSDSDSGGSGKGGDRPRLRVVK
ncbi:MAG TPA: ClpXP protease specificity-enhancing factor [Gammaproteobacteria bacterium]|nr:ClpXP protease specificity-enhancing factor [Gammaproteobacteria bacterium]